LSDASISRHPAKCLGWFAITPIVCPFILMNPVTIFFANFLSTLDYLKDNFVDKIIKDPANTNNVISDDLYKYEKEDIAKKAKESRNEEYWEKIIW
jgi:hypothetical protein